jgi:glucosamine--fructose-6-phosphate aminotransferase (isomerizing)
VKGSFFESEIREQGAVVGRLVRDRRDRAEEIARAVRARQPRFVLIAARGTSDNAARYAKYLFGAHHQLAVALAAPSLHTVYGAPPDLRDALVLGISQSGESPDVVSVIADGGRQGALTVALTNEPESPLARAAGMCLPLGAGEERAVAASKTFAAQIAGLAMLGAALAGEEERWRELAAAEVAIDSAMASDGDARAAAARLGAADRIAVLGRGFQLATAFEAALKLLETCYLGAHAFSTADFLHGPMAVVEPGFPVLFIAPSGRAAEDALEVADRLIERGALLAVISDREDLLARAALPLALGARTPEWLSPLTTVVPAQLLALRLALARGADPDRPRGLSKVTRTR